MRTRYIASGVDLVRPTRPIMNTYSHRPQPKYEMNFAWHIYKYSISPDTEFLAIVEVSQFFVFKVIYLHVFSPTCMFLSIIT